MSLALELNGEETKLLQEYAYKNQVNLAEFVLRAALEKIENEHDLQLYENAMEEYRADPITYTHEEIKQRLGL